MSRCAKVHNPSEPLRSTASHTTLLVVVGSWRSRMKGPYGLLLALLVVSGPALTAGALDHPPTAAMPPTAAPTPGRGAGRLVHDLGPGQDPPTHPVTQHDTRT